MKSNNKENWLVNGGVYHVISRSIANYQVFNTDNDYLRMIQLLRFYQRQNPPTKYSQFLRSDSAQNMGFSQYFKMVLN